MGGSGCSHDPSGLPAWCPMSTLSLGLAEPSQHQSILFRTQQISNRTRGRSLEPVSLTIVIYALRPRTGIPVRAP